MDYSQSISDFAIEQFKKSFTDQNEYDLLEDSKNIPHWKDIIEKTQTLWQKRYANHYSSNNIENEIHLIKLKEDVTKIYAKKYAKEYNQIRKYFEYVIDHQISLIRNNASSSSNQEEQKENNKPELFKLPPVSVLIKAFDISNNQPLTNNKQSNMQAKKDLIKKMGQFDVSHLIRAHSKNNDVNDTATTINDAEFEIAPNGYPTQLGHLPVYTNIAATCGDAIINFIDVETGKIIKRFNDDFIINNAKEVYSRLAWTNINGTSILAAAGSHGQIKLILPKYSVCLNRVDAHKDPVLALIFHYKFPNILLSASHDNQIKIWRIDLKESVADIECECQCELAGKIILKQVDANKPNKILNMCFLPNNHLLISTKTNNYQVHLDEDRLFNNKRKFSRLDRIEEDESGVNPEDAIKWMTSDPNLDYENLFETELVYIEGLSDNNIPFKDSFTANKIILYNNILFANLVDSNLVLILSPIYDEKRKLVKLRQISSVKIGDEKTLLDTTLSLYKVKESNILFLIKSSPLGCFYVIALDPDENYTKFILTYRCKLPLDYSIKRLSDNSNIMIKSYGLLPTPKVIKCISNGQFALTTTDSNLISIWRNITIQPASLNQL